MPAPLENLTCTQCSSAHAHVYTFFTCEAERGRCIYYNREHTEIIRALRGRAYQVTVVSVDQNLLGRSSVDVQNGG